MNFIECCEKVREKGLCMIRLQEGQSAQYDLLPFEGEEKRGWVWLDPTTANVVCQIYSVLSPERQEKFRTLPAPVIINFCWRVADGK